MRSKRMGPPSDSVRTVTEALMLRRWALIALEGKPSQVPHFSARSLSLFLEAERCFVRLKQRLTTSGAVVPAFLRAPLDTRAAEEATRVRSARRQLERIAGIARRRGWCVVVLKGGVSAIKPEDAVDMVDLDLLAPPPVARALATELREMGYRVSGAGTARHLATLSVGTELPIEIHLTLHRDGTPVDNGIWQRLRSVASIEGLRTLAAADQIWSVLDHNVMDHPERMGNTRELLLLKSAAAECSGPDWREVMARIESHSRRDILTDLVELARGCGGHPTGWSAVDRASAVGYATRMLLRDVRMPEALSGAIHRWIFDLLLGGRAVSDMWERVWARPLGYSTVRYMEAIERRLPRVGRAARVGGRAFGFGVAAMAALPIVVQVIRIARDADARMNVVP